MELKRTYRWERFEPNIGENLELPKEQRFFLLLASGLSRTALETLLEQANRPQAEEVTEESLLDGMHSILEPYARVGEPSTIDGVTVNSLRDYLKVVFEMTGDYNWLELGRALAHFNSVKGTRELFYARHSGGFSSTTSRKEEKAGSQMAAP